MQSIEGSLELRQLREYFGEKFSKIFALGEVNEFYHKGWRKVKSQEQKECEVDEKEFKSIFVTGVLRAKYNKHAE